MSSILPSSNPDADNDETFSDKFMRKSREQPLVPLGMVMTCGALYFAARAVKSGDKKMANRMFFWRVGMQGFTLCALVAGGMMVHNQRQDQEELKRQKAKDREKMWIEELERIDQESKERQKRAQTIQEAFLQRRDASHKEEESKRK